MANGRLGSAKILPYQAALLYSNTSGSQAVVNVQATGLSATSNSNLGLAIDSATVSLNQTTVAATIASGSITQYIHWLDPLSTTRPLRLEQVANSSQSNSSAYPISYWNGSTWFKPTTGYYGAWLPEKIDPYFLTNPSAYGKSSAWHPLSYQYNTNAGQSRWRVYSNLAAFTGAQFATAMQHGDPNGPAYSSSTDVSYSNYGDSGDLYSKWVMTFGDNGSLQILDALSGNTSLGSMWSALGASSITSYSQAWYAPRLAGSNGLFMIQTSGFGSGAGSWAISDPDYAVSLGSQSYAVANNGTPTAGWWRFNMGSEMYKLSWFEYNPNTQRYYFVYTGTDNGFQGIYSVSRAELRALANRGSSSGYGTEVFRKEGLGAWQSSGSGASQVGSSRPIRLQQSLWWLVAESGLAYVSTDLVSWTLATTYFPANNLPANTFNSMGASSTSYLYAQSATANISKFTSGFASVSETAVLEYNTSISNYQRTGILLSNGDKLYAQNYNAVTSLSATVMGYEG